MLELLIIIAIIYFCFGSPVGRNYGWGPRGGLLTLVCVLIVLWFLFSFPMHRYYY